MENENFIKETPHPKYVYLLYTEPKNMFHSRGDFFRCIEDHSMRALFWIIWEDPTQ